MSPMMTPLSPISPAGPYSNAHPNLFAVAASNSHRETLAEDNEDHSDEDDASDDDDPMEHFSAANLP